jgi:hypothetical protein
MYAQMASPMPYSPALHSSIVHDPSCPQPTQRVWRTARCNSWRLLGPASRLPPSWWPSACGLDVYYGHRSGGTITWWSSLWWECTAPGWCHLTESQLFSFGPCICVIRSKAVAPARSGGESESPRWSDDEKASNTGSGDMSTNWPWLI